MPPRPAARGRPPVHRTAAHAERSDRLAAGRHCLCGRRSARHGAGTGTGTGLAAPRPVRHRGRHLGRHRGRHLGRRTGRRAGSALGGDDCQRSIDRPARGRARPRPGQSTGPASARRSGRRGRRPVPRRPPCDHVEQRPTAGAAVGDDHPGRRARLVGPHRRGRDRRGDRQRRAAQPPGPRRRRAARHRLGDARWRRRQRPERPRHACRRHRRRGGQQRHRGGRPGAASPDPADPRHGRGRIRTSTAVAQGVSYAVARGAKVINMSLTMDGDDTALGAAVADAIAHNVVVVAAAGNSAQASDPILLPAAYPGVIGVAAVDNTLAAAAFSEYGPQVDLAAPGVGVLSTYAGSPAYLYMSGTSMASPYVAASAALLLAANPALTPTAVESRLERNATDLGAPGRDDHYGYGLVSPYGALTDAVGPSPIDTFVAAYAAATVSIEHCLL